LIVMPQLGIGLHEGLFVEGILNLHLGFSSNINARLQDDLSKQAAEGETHTTLISCLQYNTKNMLAQAERQSQTDDI